MWDRRPFLEILSSTRHFVDWYQASLKRKGKTVETNYVDPGDSTHPDVLGLFIDHGRDIDAN